MKLNFILKISGRSIFLLLIILMADTISLFSQSYKIKAEFNGAQDSVMYLAYYLGDKTYLLDTAYTKGKGRYVFEGDSVLPGGIYILAGQSNNKYLEVIVDKSQKFNFKTSVDRMPTDIEFTNSEDNVLFYEYINFNIEKRKAIDKLRNREKAISDQPDSLKIIKEQISDLLNIIKDYSKQLAQAHPESFVSTLLKAMEEPEMGVLPDSGATHQDSLRQYIYYKNHYWDDFDLSDDRLLRTPLYHRRLETYFNNILFQHPDTIIEAADKIIDKASPNRETFKYVVWYLTFTFETSKVMGYDKIFVHMVDTYYTSGKAFWAEKSTLKALKERADALRNVLIGEPAPDLILLDTSGTFTSLYRYQAPYTIVLFYESDCGHCRHEIEKLKSWDEKSDINFQVFAVCTDTSLVKWKKFIKKEKLPWIHANATRSVTPDYHDLYDINVTPTIYLLDEKMKIIAKRLKTEQLRPFLENYNKNKPKGD